MLIYCSICHHNYYFDINEKKLNSSNTIGAIDTNTRDKDTKKIFKYGIVSCYHREHSVSCPITANKDENEDLPRVTPASDCSRSNHE